MKTFVVMYHKFCQDGFCSAAVAHLYFLQLNKHREPKKFQVEYFPVLAGHVDTAVDQLIEKYPEPEYIKVFSFDLSFSYKAATKLFGHFTTAQVVDHHKFTYDECFLEILEGAPGYEDYLRNLEIFKRQIYFDNTRSGAVLTFQFFFTSPKIPKLVEYVEDRDLWTWKLPNSKAISAGLYRNLSMCYVNPEDFAEESPISVNGLVEFTGFDGKIPVFDKWINWMSIEDWIDQVKPEGEIVLDIQNKTIRRLYPSGKAYEIDGQKVFAVNANSFISELGNTICEWTEEDGSPSYNYAMIWRYDAPRDICNVSLRSLQETDNDVNHVAKKNGGGGHKHAAGFEIKLDCLFRVFSSGTWVQN